MAEITIRPLVEAFYKASAERDIDAAVALIDENVDWLVQGPVDPGRVHVRAAAALELRVEGEAAEHRDPLPRP